MTRKIRRTIAALSLLLLLVPAVAPQIKSKSWLRGAWEGTGYQADTDSTWSMKLTVKKLKGRRTFLIEYPSLKCGGRWKLLSLGRSRATFREHLDHGRDECTDNGVAKIERLGSGQLIFWYSRQGSHDVTASAVLNRKKPSHR